MICTRSISVVLALTIGVTFWQATRAAEFTPYIVTGVPAPDGNGTLSLPSAPSINASGQMSFVSQLTGTSSGVQEFGGLFRYGTDGLVSISRKGDPLIGRTVNFLLSSNIDESGNVHGITSMNDNLIWYLSGNGGPITSPFTHGSPSPSGNNTLLGVTTRAINDAGVTTFRAVFNGASPEAGIYLRGTDGTITTLIKQQTPAPRGGTISGTANRLAINESSQVAALMSVNSSIRSLVRAHTSGNVELAREGDVLSDGITTITKFSSDSFSSLDTIPLINDAGQVAFPAQYTQPISRFGVFLADDTGIRLLTPGSLPSAPSLPNTLDVAGLANNGAVSIFAEFGSSGDKTSALYRANESGVSLIALEDTATPVPGKFYRDIFKSGIATNAAGQIAFLAELSDTANGAAAGRGLYFYDPQGGLQQIIRTGDTLNGSTVSTLYFSGTLAGISSQSPDTSGSGLNAGGTVAFAFDLANGTSGIATWSDAAVDGDFDGDGDVDGRDFLVWQRGESPNALSGADLQLWQNAYNAGTLSAVAVPEPCSLALICGILTLAATCREATRSGQSRV